MLKYRITARISLLFGLVSLGLLLPACRLGYIMQAGTGQLKLLNNSIEIEKVLNSDTLSSEQKERLLQVARIKAFGESELGLKKSGNYRKICLEFRNPPIYLVSASLKDRFKGKTWWFPIVGDMPYLGFFDLEKARLEKEALLRQDMDVFIGQAEAYSTLGWFKDPVTLNLLEGSTNSLAEVMLHEMTHLTLYRKGQSELNEGLAVMVGLYGALAFFRENYGDSHPFSLEAGRAIHDEIIFADFLDRLLNRFEKLYSSPLGYGEKLEQRKDVFNEALEEFGRIEEKFKTNRFSAFGRKDMNNAYLMTIGLYHRHFNLFRKILQYNHYSIKDTMALLKTITANQAEPVRRIGDWVKGKKSDSGFLD